MTTLTATRPQGFAFGFNGLTEAVRKFATYRRTVSELNGLSDRALADLGMTRAAIAGFARSAVYGA